jgi:hypothetical protein
MEPWWSRKVTRRRRSTRPETITGSSASTKRRVSSASKTPCAGGRRNVCGSSVAVAPHPRLCARLKAGETRKTRREGRVADTSASSRNRSSSRRLLSASTSSNRKRSGGRGAEAREKAAARGALAPFCFFFPLLPLPLPRPPRPPDDDDDDDSEAIPSTSDAYAAITSPSVPCGTGSRHVPLAASRRARAPKAVDA